MSKRVLESTMLEESLKKTKLSGENHFSNDVLGEILSHHYHDVNFIVTSCALVSKQWLNVLSERAKLVVTCKKHPQGQFLNNIASLSVEYDNNSRFDSSVFGKMKQLTKLDIQNNKFGVEGAKHIGLVKQLTYLDINGNKIGAEGAKSISELKELTYLDIRNNNIGMLGAKHISELKKLTILDINSNKIGPEGAKHISSLPKLTNLNIRKNGILVEGAKFISEMNQLTSLDITKNNIGDKGAKFISQLNQLTHLDTRSNNISNEGAKFIIDMKLASLEMSHNNLKSTGPKNYRSGMDETPREDENDDEEI